MYSINLNFSGPIYKQIVNEIEVLILKSTLKENEKLLSVRETAKLLGVNDNTVQKAYRELEKTGYIYTIPGKGSYVNDISKIKSFKNRQLIKELEVILSKLILLNLSSEEIISITTNIINKNEPETKLKI